MNLHLNDEDFADLLAGEEPNTAAEHHLFACAACREELSSLQAAANSFHALSFAWAQAEAPRLIQSPTPFARLLDRGRPVWALGLTSALLAGVVSTHVFRPGSMEPTGIPVAVTAPRSAPAEVADDNRLMESIDNELQSSPEPAVPVDELRASARRTAQPPTAAVTN